MRSQAERSFRGRKIRQVVTAVYLFALTIAVVVWIRDLKWQELNDVSAMWWLVILATGVSIGARFWMAFAWWRMLVRSNPQTIPRYLRVLAVFAQAWMSRYFPIKGAWIVHRIALAGGVGVPRNRVIASTFVESITQLGATGVVALGTVAFHPVASKDPVFTLVVLLLGVTAVIGLATPRVLRWTLFRIRAWGIGRELDLEGIPDGKTYAESGALQTVTAVLSGVSTALFVVALSGPVGITEFLFIVGLASLASAFGVVAFFAPAGIGVREVTLIAGLAPLVGLPVAVLIAGTSRVWSIAVDFLFLGIALVSWRLFRIDSEV